MRAATKIFQPQLQGLPRLRIPAYASSRGGGIVDLIPLLNQNRFLDIVVQDESAVDHIKLTLTAAISPGPIRIVPVPTVLGPVFVFLP